MIAETLLHIDEELSAQQQQALLTSIGNSETGLFSSRHSTKEHLMFVAYDTQQMTAQEITSIAHNSGYHAQIINL